MSSHYAKSIFTPFKYQGAFEHEYALSREGEADEVRALLDDYGLVVITGRSGYGKTTFLRSALREAAADLGRRYLYVKVPPSADLAAFCKACELALANGGFESHGDKQQVGNISESSDVRVTQVIQAGPDYAVIDRLVGLGPCLVVLDQYERFFPGHADDACRLADMLAQACEGNGADRPKFVIGINQHSVGELLGAVRPNDRFFSLGGLDAQKASRFVLAASGGNGAFGVYSTGRLVRLLDDETGHVWPLGLVACCSVLQRSDEDMLDVDGFDLERCLGEAIENSLPQNSGFPKDDLTLALCIVSRKKKVCADDILPYFPSLGHSLVKRLLDVLVEASLLEKNIDDSYTLIHESAVRGVAYLEAHNPRIAAMIAFSSNGLSVVGAPYSERRAAVLSLMKHGGLPFQMTFLASVVLFGNDGECRGGDLTARLGRELRGSDIDSVTESADYYAARCRELGLRAEACLAPLFLDGRDECIVHALGLLHDGVQHQKLETEEWLLAKAMLLADAADLWNCVACDDALMKDLRVSSPALGCLQYGLDNGSAGSATVDESLLKGCWDEAPALRERVLKVASGRYALLSRLVREGIGGSDTALREACVKRLPEIGDAAKGSLTRLLAQDSDIGVRRAAAYALSDYLGCRETRVAVADAWQCEPSPLVREAIVESINESRAPEYRELLLSAADDPIDYVRESAVFALYDIFGNASLVDVVGLYSDRSAKVRDAMVKCFGLPGDERIAAEYMRDLRDQPASLQMKILEECCRIEGGEEMLADVLSGYDYSESVVSKALQLSAEIRSEKCARLAETFLRSRNVDMVCDAIVAVQNGLPPQERLPEILALANHPSASVRERVVYALAEIASSEAEEALMTALFDPEQSIRIRALYALGKLGSDRAISIARGMRGSQALVDARNSYLRSVGAEKSSAE